MASHQHQEPFLNTDGQTMADQPQAQLTREAVISEPTNTMGMQGQVHRQSPNIMNQTGDSVKTMAYGAADIASGAARGAMGLAQGAAIGAANLAQGAANAVKNTFGMNPDNSYDLNSNDALPTTNRPNNPPPNPRI